MSILGSLGRETLLVKFSKRPLEDNPHVTFRTFGTIGDRIRMRRKELRWTQSKLGAEMKRCSKGYASATKGAISQWEKNNIKTLSSANFFAVALALRLNPLWLAFETGHRLTEEVDRHAKSEANPAIIRIAEKIYELPKERQELLLDLLNTELDRGHALAKENHRR